MLNKIKKSIGVFLLTIIMISTLQWICIQVMATSCAPWGWCGPIKNVLSLGSPVCHFLNKFQMGLCDYYITIWAAAATSCITYIVTNT